MQRTKILKTVCLVAFAIIAVRLFFIQIIEHDDWVAKADDQHTLLETIKAERGEIYMMEGGEPKLVVGNSTVYSVIIDPAVTDKEKITVALNEFAKDQIVADLDQVFETEGLRYSIVAKNVSYINASKIAEQGISGVWLQQNNQRFYTDGELASGLLGFVNADGIGQYGVEGSLNKTLSGTDGLLKTISDINNVALSIGNDNVRVPAEDGKNVVLSVDRGLQYGIEELAMNAIENTAATNASVIVMDPETNEVLTMANLPNYDPSNYGYVKDATAYMNYATEVPYAPASVCKNFIFAAAINEGKMTAGTTFLNEHYTVVNGRSIWNDRKDSKLYGETDMKKAFYWSMNTGSIEALRLLGDDRENIDAKARETLYDYYYNKFRLGRATNFGLLEADGFLIEPHAEIYDLNGAYADMTYGQNLGLTMIQVATAFSAVVNGGYYRTPSIVKGMLENGEIVKSNNDSAINEQILTSETSATMRELLVNNHYSFYRTGYEIGGKTGTGQVVVDGVYDENMTIGSYTGFVATSGEMPSYIVMVKLWGDGEHLTGVDANNLFDPIANFIIDYFKMKPGAI